MVEEIEGLKHKAQEYAAKKCHCIGCPVGHTELDREYQEWTCDKFNRYVKLFMEIAEPYEKRIAELESTCMDLHESIDLMRSL